MEIYRSPVSNHIFGCENQIYSTLFSWYNHSYSGNINLHGARRGRHMGIIIGSSVGAAVLLITTLVSCMFMQKGKKRHPDQGMAIKQF
jgi:hypothetical protein